MNAVEIFNLKYPFKHRGEDITVLEMRRPKVRDLKKFQSYAESDPIGAFEKVIGDLVGKDEAIITEIDLEDFGPLRQRFEDFLLAAANASKQSS